MLLFGHLFPYPFKIFGGMVVFFLVFGMLLSFLRDCFRSIHHAFVQNTHQHGYQSDNEQKIRIQIQSLQPNPDAPQSLDDKSAEHLQLHRNRYTMNFQSSMIPTQEEDSKENLIAKKFK
jgi:hypothetical protein